jgi:uncharacterized phage-associated protein
MFSFNLDKLIHTIIFFVKNTDSHKLGKVKLMKLLFFSDFRHMKKYGRPIIGDTYMKLPRGPVPSFSLDLISEAETCSNDLPDEEDLADTKDYVQKIKNSISISTKDFYGKKKLDFTPLIEFDPKFFSKSDLSILKEVADEFYSHNGTQISNKSHKEQAWLLPEMFSQIDFRYALDVESLDYYDYWEKTMDSFRKVIALS